jgi:hypothetical protein
VNQAHAQPEASGGAQGKIGDDATIQRKRKAASRLACAPIPHRQKASMSAKASQEVGEVVVGLRVVPI